mmetsp:Transcript_7599/g.14111  ORF Transcript_7599/g.14111 Transcript_7599/m.14111 type:complete len:205 (+) Transcript_7599:453-1067(+)
MCEFSSTSHSSSGFDGTLDSEGLGSIISSAGPEGGVGGVLGRRFDTAHRGLSSRLDGTGLSKGGRSGVVGRRLSGVVGRRLGKAELCGRKLSGVRGPAQTTGGDAKPPHIMCGGDGGAAQNASHLASNSLSSSPLRSLPRSGHLGDRLRSRDATEREVIRPPPICSRHPSHSPCPQGSVTKGVVSSKQTGQVASINWRWPHSRL